MKRYIYIIMLAMLLHSCSADARDISVLLAENAQECRIGGTSYVIKVATGAVTPPITGSFAIVNGGAALKAGKVTYALPVSVTSASPIIIDGVAYHGGIVFERSSSGFNIVNKVDVEDYLKGVLKDEMSPAWPAEALKAQAVLARTYALSSKKHGRYDLCARVHCQSYGGTANESQSINAAVSATAGEILKYGGSAAEAYFYGDSGGYGASAKSVWGKDIPYLRARPDPVASTGPNTRWQTTLPMSQIESRLAAAGVNVGKISSIKPYSRDESGRMAQLEVVGSGGRKLITGGKFRAAIGSSVIKSTLFEFGQPTPYTPALMTVPAARSSQPKPQPAAQQPVKAQPRAPIAVDRSTMPESDIDKLYWMERNGVFTLQELVSMIGKEKDYPRFVAEGEARIAGTAGKAEAKPVNVPQAQPSVPTAAQSAQEITAAPPRLSMREASGSSVTISGRGSGHGAGMPQWTAKAMAEAGWDYRRILDYYFRGTTIER